MLTRSKTFVINRKNDLKTMPTIMDGYNLDAISKKLPKNFFEKLFITEMELEEKFSEDKLKELFQLYLSVIQYYSIKDKSKVKEYKNRMDNHLTQESTLKNLSKINLKKYKEKYKKKTEDLGLSLPSNKSLKIRGRAKTIFKVESQKIRTDDIRKKVKVILEDVIILMKIDKNNLKNNISKELKKQRRNWIEKLRKKHTFVNTRINRIRTIHIKAPSTPDRLKRRKSLEFEKKKQYEKSGKYLPKFPNIDDESSEMEESKNKLDDKSDLMKLYNDIEGGKKRKNDSDSDSSSESDSNSSSGSIIGDDYQDCDINKIEEDEKSDKKQENNYKDKESKIVSKSNLPIIKEIDENEENKENNINNKNNNDNKNRMDINIIRNYIEQFMTVKKEKTSSAKYLPKLELKLEEVDKDDKVAQPPNKNDINDNQKKNDINENEPNKIPARKRKSIVDENVIREVELDEDIRNITKEKMQSLENLLDDIDSGSESNFTSTTSLPSVSKPINIEQIPAVFQPYFTNIEEKIKSYCEGLHTNYYNEIFENFSIKLKELYEEKYKKYILVNNEYHSSIIENEFKYENEEKIDENEKIHIKNIIESLKEEEKDQIDKILDEYNSNISALIDDFKHNCFKKNIGIQLRQEQLKLDIYTIINEAFY